MRKAVGTAMFECPFPRVPEWGMPQVVPQVFLSPESDHYRTRLTHTLEVSQIARTIASALRLNEELTEAIALGHDLGHTHRRCGLGSPQPGVPGRGNFGEGWRILRGFPPACVRFVLGSSWLSTLPECCHSAGSRFRYAGERALKHCCPYGFSHPVQSVRVVEKLENGGAGLPLGFGAPQVVFDRPGDLFLRKHLGAHRIFQVMVEVGDLVRFYGTS